MSERQRIRRKAVAHRRGADGVGAGRGGQPAPRRSASSPRRPRGARMLVVLPEYFPLVGMNERDKIAVREQDGAGPIQDFLRAWRRATRHLAGRRLRSAGGERSGQGAQFLPGLRRRGPARGALRQDPPVRLRARQRALRRVRHHRGGRAGGDLRLALGPGRAVDLLRPALPRAVSRDGRGEPDLRCRQPSPRPPGEAIGNCCCARARWRTSAMWWRRRRAARMPSGRMTYGDSMIVDPWGVVLARLAKGEGVVTRGSRSRPDRSPYAPACRRCGIAS